MPANDLPTLEISRLRRGNASGLLALLSALQATGESTLFSPHPFTAEQLETLCRDEQKDLYYVALAGSEVLAYGLLRGWSEGYETPSLGIATHPEHRGRGLATAMMTFLHAAASIRGATRVRLRVHKTNRSAIQLYERLGYVFEPAIETDHLLVAHKALVK